MRLEGPLTGVAQDAERILRSRPMWFGIEAALQEYVQDTERLPTFVAHDGQAIESWLARRGVRYLQVKTISASSPSKEYAQTRAFYLAIGYQPLEEFPLLWEPRLPVLQLVKALAVSAGPSHASPPAHR